MKMKKVKSSNMMAVGYDAKHNVLEIEFKGGVSYRYKDVPVKIYHQLLNSVSKGSYFHSHIRDVYKAEKIEDEVA